MRITSGEFSGIRLFEVKDKRTRMSLDRVRESLFNSLRGTIEDKIFWDLFAGSGAVGIEAISMGAKFVIFVEKRFDAINVIRKNLSIIKVNKEKFKIFKMDVFKFLKLSVEPKPDFIFLDPPYGRNLGKKTLEILSNSNIIKDETIIIYERSKREEIEYCFSRYKTLRIGETFIDFLRRG